MSRFEFADYEVSSYVAPNLLLTKDVTKSYFKPEHTCVIPWGVHYDEFNDVQSRIRRYKERILRVVGVFQKVKHKECMKLDTRYRIQITRILFILLCALEVL